MPKQFARAIASAAGAIATTAAIVAGLAMHPSAAKAATPFASHLITVNPQIQPADAADGSSGGAYQLRRCQVINYPGNVGACYDPYQMRHAYGVDGLISAGYDGTGKTIIIVDAYNDPYLAGDLAYFDAYYGLPAANLTVTHPGTATPAFDQGWAEETTLDVEWSHALAPGAKIVLVEAQTNQDTDILDAINFAVNNNLGDVISQSFGENETCVDPKLVAAQHQAYANATSKGITIFASSGDQGASQQTCDGSSWTQVTSFPADDPLVTAVGGTDLHAAGFCFAAFGCDPSTAQAPGTYQSEVAWNEFNSESTGGGFSKIYSEPSYQQGTIHGGTQRAVPDVAYNGAIYDGVLVYLFGGTKIGGFYRFGGTSCGSPQWAAIAAIADQKAGHDLGFLNKALYHIGQAPPHYAAGFHDTTSGTNTVTELDAYGNPVTVQGYNAGSGWDPTTGLGSPIVGPLVDELIQFVAPGDAQSAIAQSNH